ncbi:MAG: AbrB/MazE/SpoVT family DNA-binding domain-containing protein [Bacilli bacterium]|nr:AbrB/MazE/SpoVT family DNA-binding domain-containing protein [Bacilli bacterium]
MKTGMIRRIDELGRIVIPKEIRTNLRLNMGDIVEIFVEDNKILLKRFSTILGFEEELFNIAKVLNELTQATILFIEHDKVIVSYGKRSELYLDQEINKQLYNKITNNSFIKTKDIYIISNEKEERNVYMALLSIKGITQGLFILIENEHAINQIDLETINQFKKFIIKQLDR